jgi:hypothetical protein
VIRPVRLREKFLEEVLRTDDAEMFVNEFCRVNRYSVDEVAKT